MKYCSKCGKEIHEDAVICVNCGCQIEGIKKEIDLGRNKWVALILWLFLGVFGAHKFYTGNVGVAVAYIICFTIGWLAFCIPPLIATIFLIIDLVKILQGEMDGVKLEG